MIQESLIWSHSSASLDIIQSLETQIHSRLTSLRIKMKDHLAEAHVLLGHEVGQDTASRPGQTHVAVHHHQASTIYGGMDEVCCSMEIP